MSRRINILIDRSVELLEKVVIFGAGQNGILMMYLAKYMGINVIACLDNDANKSGKVFLGDIKCLEPYYIENVPIIVTVYKEEIAKKLTSQCKVLGYKDIIYLDFSKIEDELKKLPDKNYLELRYAMYFEGKVINWDNPKTFNEKLQWLKLYDRNSEYIKLVDKYEFKKHIAGVLGEEFVIPTLGVWDTVEEIEWDNLPNQFVLKCTHDSGSVLICRDKNNFNIEEATEKLKRSYECDFYLMGREWPYKDVKHRIIAEQYMQDGVKSELRDYKFYCFSGVPKFLYISEGLENHKTARISFIDIEGDKWEFAPFRRTDFREFATLPQIPDNYREMFRIAEILSEDYPFVRVDLYTINGKIYPSELTFTPGAGFTKYEPEEWNYRLGDMIKLPPNSQ